MPDYLTGVKPFGILADTYPTEGVEMSWKTQVEAIREKRDLRIRQLRAKGYSFREIARKVKDISHEHVREICGEVKG